MSLLKLWRPQSQICCEQVWHNWGQAIFLKVSRIAML